MKLTYLMPAVWFLLAVAPVATAGDTLSVQLVTATSEGKGRVDDRLRKVAPAIERNFAYTGYAVMAATTMPLPADGTPRLLGAYQVKCSGPQAQLSISVEQRNRPVLKTKVVLSDRKPFILGGLPSSAGAQMLVFEVQ